MGAAAHNEIDESKESLESKLRVLLIEDSEADVEIISVHLRRAIPNVELSHTETLEAGLNLLENHRVDIVLLDYMLPDGVEGTKYINDLRNVSRDWHLPVIVLTSMNSEVVLLQAFQSGASDYIHKRNITRSSILRSVDNAVDRARLARDNERSQKIIQENSKELNIHKHHISSFYQNVSHELKSPLTGAREFVALVTDGVAGEVSEQQHEMLSRALSCCDTLTDLIHDLLDTTALENNRLKLHSAPCDIVALVEKCVQRQRCIAKESGQEIELFCCDGVPTINCDSLRIEQILTNLLNNALHYNIAPGKIAASIELSEEHGQVEISVADCGVGIEEALHERIFDRFFEVNPDSLERKPGLGLGLSLARDIAELHGGTLSVDSKPGKGSRFTARLPL